MRFTGLFVVLAACGTSEGSELPYRIPACDVLDEQVVSDTLQPHYALQPLDELVAPMLGSFEVVATLTDDPEGPTYSGTLVITQAPGEVVARDQEWPDDKSATGANENCEDDYLVEVLAELQLDDDAFGVSGPLVLSVQNGPFSWVALTESPPWWGPDTLTGSLVGSDATVTDAVLDVVFADSTWSGGASLRGESEDGESSWVLLRFESP